MFSVSKNVSEAARKIYVDERVILKRIFKKKDNLEWIDLVGDSVKGRAFSTLYIFMFHKTWEIF